ncbi:MAG TPA: aminomethyltransferase beta-barrel domain-containing protein, partial [Burkholderiaceae bacterium]|nr:aminomethyltransferase beta-barrel domain-containing protein [Burkholderiaceae bacterium]
MKAYKKEDGSSDAWYVARKDIANNTLYIVQGHDHPWLLSSTLRADQASWIAGTPPAPRALSAKTRYRQADVACTVTPDGEANFALQFEQPQWAVTPGQSAVLYDGDVCLGGGIIAGSDFSA